MRARGAFSKPWMTSSRYFIRPYELDCPIEKGKGTESQRQQQVCPWETMLSKSFIKAMSTINERETTDSECLEKCTRWEYEPYTTAIQLIRNNYLLLIVSI